MRSAGGQQPHQPPQKVVREVVMPEVMTVHELGNRMAARGAEVVKTLMKLGVMATINQTIDADTAELVVGEFGHKSKRVSASDVEIGMRGAEDRPEELQTRPPVVTIMGHVDHGKTRSEEHTSELQSIMRISYAALCLKNKKKKQDKR